MPAAVSVLVCRGCCCGTDKHPTVDHAGQLAALRAAAGGRARFATVDCLGACEHSNVVVVRAGGQRHWFGAVLEPATTAALAGWVAAGAEGPVPAVVEAHRFVPVGPTLPPLDWSPTAIAAFVAGASGPWTIGVHGAAAELVVIDGVSAAPAQGELGLTITAVAAAFGVVDPATGDPRLVVLAVPAGSVAPPAAGLRVLGPDADALRPADRAATLIDLGLGRRSLQFCVRTADPALIAGLGVEAGVEWTDLLERPAGRALLAASPTRVVRSALGRIEIHAPIPRPDERSPDGPHTHLLAGELDLDLDLPPGIELPDGWLPAATFYAT